MVPFNLGSRPPGQHQVIPCDPERPKGYTTDADPNAEKLAGSAPAVQGMLKVKGDQSGTLGEEILHNVDNEVPRHRGSGAGPELVHHSFRFPVVTGEAVSLSLGEILARQPLTAIAWCQVCQMRPDSLLQWSVAQFSFRLKEKPAGRVSLHRR